MKKELLKNEKKTNWYRGWKGEKIRIIKNKLF